MVRLTGGVRPGPGRSVWIAGPGLCAVPLTSANVNGVAPGVPVAVGPRQAGPTAAAAALAELERLVADSGRIVAEAAVDLGSGFRSARVDGGLGDRRDGVLAALVAGCSPDRLGALPTEAETGTAAGTSVTAMAGAVRALFGVAATKPLGAAAGAVAEAGRWPVLRLAVMAGDLLGPEQLVRLLALTAPPGVDPFPAGLPSQVGRELAWVLGPLSRSRRLDLLIDLWHRVCDERVDDARRRRLREARPGRPRDTDLTIRYARYEQEEVGWFLPGGAFGSDGQPDLLVVARWRPTADYWRAMAARVHRDALAATVLAKVAAAGVEHGPLAAIERHRDAIAAVADAPGRERIASVRMVPGCTGLPARPGSVLADLLHRTKPGRQRPERSVRHLVSQLRHAGAYGRTVLAAVDRLVHAAYWDGTPVARQALASWAAAGAADWRMQVGYSSPERLAHWEQPPPFGPDGLTPLADRLGRDSDRPVAERAVDIEVTGDLFWYAELADAVARLNGRRSAEVMPAVDGPYCDTDPIRREEPPSPSLCTVPQAVAVAAQLVGASGGAPGVRTGARSARSACRDWSELLSGLLADAAVAETQAGTFPVPAAVQLADGTLLPGTEARIEVARTPRQLVGWSEYMGNCIAGPPYATDAEAGRSVLIALRGPDRRILLNAELRWVRRGWWLGEVRARFNAEPDPELLARIRDWLVVLPPSASATDSEDSDDGSWSPADGGRGACRGPALGWSPDRQGLEAELGSRLEERLLAVSAAPAASLAAEVMVALAAGLGRCGSRRIRPIEDPLPAYAALARADRQELVPVVRRALADPAGPGLASLWAATGLRPLTSAVSGLSAADAGRLAPLLADGPLPRSLRRLAAADWLASARTAQLVACRLRAALGTLLALDSPELAAAVRSAVTVPGVGAGGCRTAVPLAGFVRAAGYCVTCWGGLPAGHRRPQPAGPVVTVVPHRRARVPGFAESRFDGARWRVAAAEAAELGPTGAFWEHLAAHGLLIPRSWLGHGGWPALWSGAVRGSCGSG